MKIVRFSDLVEVPWKNGGGVTREIAEYRDAGALLWRLSMADVASDGPFSDFAGLTRILTVIDGTGMELATPHGTLHADFAVPIRFDGGLPVTSRLKRGPLRDLNLMFDPRRIEGSATALSAPARPALRPDAGLTYAVHCLSGAVGMAGAGSLERGDTALIDAGEVDLDLKAGALALLVTMAQRAQTDASSAATASR